MKAIISRTAAVAAMLVCLGNVQAEELNFSELESRLANIESQLAGQNGMQQASYCDNGDCCDTGCCDTGCCDTGCGDSCGSCGGCNSYYASVEMVWARFHANEGAVGSKLSETYNIAPRFIVGYENSNGRGARIRYWNYNHATPTLGAGPVDVGLQVLDLEVTNRFQFCRTDVTLAAGFRSANFDLTDAAGATSSADLIGLTMAADVEYLVCCDCNSYWSGLYGGRLSVLGGNWEGASAWTPANRDDNMVVTELYGGVEYGRCQGGYDIYTQFKFEIQNWQSDAIAANVGTTLGFVGPSWTIGVGF